MSKESKTIAEQIRILETRSMRVGETASTVPLRERSQGLARSLAGCIYREKSIESSSVTADPSAIGQAGHRPAHLHGTRAIDGKGALVIAHGRLARYAQISRNAGHVFRGRLAVELNAVALARQRFLQISFFRNAFLEIFFESRQAKLQQAS